MYRRVRIKAAESNTSVSALVKGFFMQLIDEESDFDRRLRLERETLAGIHNFCASGRLSRDEVHDRHALS